MGEARAKSRHRRDVLLGNSRCVYCEQPAATVEHMPPRSMFMGKLRLSGLEFPSCSECNEATRGADALAAFFSRMSPSSFSPQWEIEEAYKLISPIRRNAPQALEEIFDPNKVRTKWTRGRDSIFTRKHEIQIQGPVVHALMTAFSAKLGMSLFAEHIGYPMPVGSGVYTQFYLNAGLTRQTAEAILSILPLGGQLRQGRLSSGKQFNYRYNTDKKTIIAVFAAFNDNLFVRSIATLDTSAYEFLTEEYNSGFVPMGGLPLLAKQWMPSQKK